MLLSQLKAGLQTHKSTADLLFDKENAIGLEDDDWLVSNPDLWHLENQPTLKKMLDLKEQARRNEIESLNSMYRDYVART